MDTNENKNKLVYVRWILLRLALVVFDIVAVNFSYALALVTRFYVASEFNIWGVRYIEPFLRFAPWYTLSCLVIFALFKLYNSRWKYAGLNDMNRIVLACLLTTLVQVIGSALFVMRMPITYYVIGGLFQFGLIAGSRFSYRIFLMERERVRKMRSGTSINVMIAGASETSHLVRKHLERDPENAAHPVCILDFRERVRKMRSGTSINVMIAGASETSHLVRKHLERDPENAAHPVCILDFRGEEFGTMLEGLPVVGGMDKLESAIAKYNVECVIPENAAHPVCILDFRGEEFGTMLEGLPVVGGMDKLESAIAKYNVECVILADMTMPDSVRKEIRKICAGLNVEVQDFSGYFQDARGALTLRNLMGYRQRAQRDSQNLRRAECGGAGLLRLLPGCPRGADLAQFDGLYVRTGGTGYGREASALRQRRASADESYRKICGQGCLCTGRAAGCGAAKGHSGAEQY